MAPFVKVDHVQLAIPPSGEDRARQFYVAVLGLEEVQKPTQLAERGGLDFRPAKKAHPAFRCSDYEALLQRLERNHAEIIHDNRPVGGARHCYVADPFGNRLELIAG